MDRVSHRLPLTHIWPHVRCALVQRRARKTKHSIHCLWPGRGSCYLIMRRPRIQEHNAQPRCMTRAPSLQPCTPSEAMFTVTASHDRALSASSMPPTQRMPPQHTTTRGHTGRGRVGTTHQHPLLSLTQSSAGSHSLSEAAGKVVSSQTRNSSGVAGQVLLGSEC